MATINQIAIYNKDDNKWEINKISVDASNVTYKSSSLKNTLDTIIDVLPTNSDPFPGNAVLVTDNDGKITTSGISSDNLNDTISTTIPGIQTEISSINNNIKNAIKNPLIAEGYFTATTLDETTNFKFKIPNTMREPATVTDAPSEIKVQKADDSIKPTVGGSLLYARADHAHVLSGSPTFVSPMATKMPAVGSTSNALVNANYVTNYFTSIWNKTHYTANQDIRLDTSKATENFDAFGWVTGEGKNLYIEIIMRKSYIKMDGTYLKFSPTAAAINLRSSDDNKTYLVEAGFNVKNLISNIFCDKDGFITIICTRSAGWGVSNNSICTGNIALAGKWTN